MSYAKGKLSIVDRNRHGDCYIGIKGGDYLAIVTPFPDVDAEANAAEIVRRWNSHEALLEACEAVKHSWYYGYPVSKSVLEKQVDAAIAEAKE